MLTNDRQLETDKKASKELNEAHTGSGEGFLQDDEALLDEIEGLETLKRTVVGKNRDFTDDSEKEIAVILKVLVENSSEGAVYKLKSAAHFKRGSKSLASYVAEHSLLCFMILSVAFTLCQHLNISWISSLSMLVPGHAHNSFSLCSMTLIVTLTLWPTFDSSCVS
jgi:hypothetical protein